MYQQMINLFLSGCCGERRSCRFGMVREATMRILVVGNYELDKQRSMRRYAETLREQLSLRGCQVEVIRPGTVVGDWVRQPGLRKWLGYIDKYLFFPLALRRRAAEFDVVHVCDHSNSMYLAHTAGRASSITCHDLLAIECALGRYPQQKVSFSGKILQRWILRHLAAAGNVICVSSNSAQELAALSNSADQRIAVIPNVLDSACLRATPEAILSVRRRIGLGAEEPYVFYIGAEAWYKNRTGVLRIFQKLLVKLNNRFPGLRLVVAGAAFNSEMRAFADAELPAGTVLEVVGPADDDLWALYSGAAALLFPSWHEGFGWPVIEAQRCGCPVIASNRAPMTEIAGSAALYIDPADEDGAAASIAANFDRLGDMREAGFRNAERFDAGVVFQAYADFFARVLGTETA
jgi:glycosyltransferase involved in cell wall biosynthesis